MNALPYLDSPSQQDASLDLLSIACVIAFQASLLMVAPFSGLFDVNIIVFVLLGAAVHSAWRAFELRDKAAASAESVHVGSTDSSLARRDRWLDSRTRRQSRPAPVHATISENKSADDHFVRHGEKMQRSKNNELNNDSRRWVSDAASHYPKRAASQTFKKARVQSTPPVTSLKKSQPNRQEDVSGLPALQLVRERSLPLERTFSRAASSDAKSSGVRFYADVVSRAQAVQLAARGVTCAGCTVSELFQDCVRLE